MKKIEWGYLIVSYLFLGGLSAGLYFVSALACLLQKNGEDSAYKRIAKIGALLAPWPAAPSPTPQKRAQQATRYFSWSSPLRVLATPQAYA